MARLPLYQLGWGLGTQPHSNDGYKAMSQLSFSIRRILQLAIAELNPDNLSPYQRLSFFKKQLKKEATISELAFMKILEKLRIRFIFQKGFILKCKYPVIVDFYIPKPHRVIFEIDGKYHKDINQKDLDCRRTEFLESNRNVKVFRFTNDEVLNRKSFVMRKVK